MKKGKDQARNGKPNVHFTDDELMALDPLEHPGLFRKIDPADPLFKSEVLPQALRSFSYVEDKEGTWRSALPRAFYLLEDAKERVVEILKRAPQPPTGDSMGALVKFVDAAHDWSTELMNALRPGTLSEVDPSQTIIGLFRPAPEASEAGLPLWTMLVDSLTPFLGEIPEDLRPHRQLSTLRGGLDSLNAYLKAQGALPSDTPVTPSSGYIKLIGRSVVMALQGLTARLLAWLSDRVAMFKEATLPRFEFTYGRGHNVSVAVIYAGHTRTAKLSFRLAQLVGDLFEFKRVEMFKKHKSAISKALQELQPHVHPMPPAKSPRRKKHRIEYRLDAALFGRLDDPKRPQLVTEASAS